MTDSTKDVVQDAENIEAAGKAKVAEAESYFSKLGDELKTAEVKVVAEVKAVEAAVVAKADGAIKWFKTVLGYPLHDPSSKVTVSNSDPTEAPHTPWVQTQIDAGLIQEVPPPVAPVAAAAASTPTGDPTVVNDPAAPKQP
jgi:hypothetical protein